MKKYTKGEGKLEVLRGAQANVLNQHFAKTGKYQVSDFTEEERKALDEDLTNAEESE